jgi:hypothetical protein
MPSMGFSNRPNHPMSTPPPAHNRRRNRIEPGFPNMNTYIIKTKSGRRIIERAASEEAAKKKFETPRDIIMPWTNKVVTIPSGEPIDKVVPLGTMPK